MKTIGKITRTHGFEGAVVIRSEGTITDEPEQGEPVFVVIDGLPVPFFTREAYSPSHDTLIISFDYYLTPESVRDLKGCDVMIPGETDPGDDFEAVTGFTLKDSASGFTGKVTGIIRHPGQLLATVASEKGEITVPLHPDLIVSVDNRRRIITMNLPEGLTEINL